MKMNRTEAIMQLIVIREAKDILYQLELSMLSDKLTSKTYTALLAESDKWLGYRNAAWRKLIDGTKSYDCAWSNKVVDEAIDLIYLTVI